MIFFAILAGSRTKSSSSHEQEIHHSKCVKQKRMTCEICLHEFLSETSLKMHNLICVKKKNPDLQS